MEWLLYGEHSAPLLVIEDRLVEPHTRLVSGYVFNPGGHIQWVEDVEPSSDGTARAGRYTQPAAPVVEPPAPPVDTVENTVTGSVN